MSGCGSDVGCGPCVGSGLITGRYTLVTISSGPYNAVSTARYIIVVGGLPLTVNLPAAPLVGDWFVVKDGVGTAAASNITVDGNGNTIDGAATQLIATNYGALKFIFNGTEWNVV